MQDADEPRQSEEPRIGLQQHSLDFVDLRRASARLGGLVESVSHGSEDLELEEGHRLERDLKWEGWGGAVELNVVRAKMPELVGEDDWVVFPDGTCLIALVGNEVDVCEDIYVVREYLGWTSATDVGKAGAEVACTGAHCCRKPRLE